ncbi:unnamed protein product [Closterium sp. NIES-54]
MNITPCPHAWHAPKGVADNEEGDVLLGGELQKVARAALHHLPVRHLHLPPVHLLLLVMAVTRGGGEECKGPSSAHQFGSIDEQHGGVGFEEDVLAAPHGRQAPHSDVTLVPQPHAHHVQHSATPPPRPDPAAAGDAGGGGGAAAGGAAAAAAAAGAAVDALMRGALQQWSTSRKHTACGRSSGRSGAV